ncbi:hypothetical protein CspeluHIS016_0100940 [Cutaneotrichosporon spelunceum]|uniref:Major facilitator superfamily (MFS) profile domain-containing protein n=1 Tax=Cutaneotrichosporon spelunceum TaxID=1672016 RepID=A0AAD3TMF2_9TREE|nr:hypothetical protein CspeluHIS016_0100940 [Cutaneotrichosporon spelunceum]
MERRSLSRSRPLSASHSSTPTPHLDLAPHDSNHTRLDNALPASYDSDSESEDAVRDAIRDDDDRGIEETLERLGFGRYQWVLFALCGCGWMSDNSALQCIAVVLPRVRIHFNLGSEIAGLLSASMMAGMMFGAVGWGVISDMLGRALPFHSTLLLTAVFGIAASFAPNFWVLCICMFFLGTAVGGSMPTDGTLFLENLPHSKQYLLTLLSVFFSFGAVLASAVGYALLPSASCRDHDTCDFESGANDGWRHVLFTLGAINLTCAIARSVLFRLHESPRFLVSSGRDKEAVVVLQAIADFNRHSMDIDHNDVRQSQAAGESGVSALGTGYEESQVLISASEDTVRSPPTSPMAPTSPLTQRSPLTPPSRVSRRDSSKRKVDWLHDWNKQMAKLFSPRWRRTVILMWIIWALMAFAYTMFNVWLPSVLESRQGDDDNAIAGALKEYVLYAAAGCPGSVLGSWMVQTKLGRRKSLAMCTLATGLAMLAFIRVRSKIASTISSMLISLAGTAMYAVLYGMTPETFGTSIRGTACGTSAALSRLAGVIAPVFAGVLLAIQPTLPLIVTAIVYGITAFCALLLPKNRVTRRSGGGGLMH